MKIKIEELSIEEKAKLYDEAKARMSRAYNSNRCTIGFMNEIFPESKESKEKEFHNRRITFYINKYNTIIFIKKGQSHIEYFKEIGHSEYINFVTRGYILDDHIMFYKGNNFEIPDDLTIKTILNLVSFINKPSIKWVGLGCIIGKVGEEWSPKITITIKKNI